MTRKPTPPTDNQKGTYASAFEAGRQAAASAVTDVLERRLGETSVGPLERTLLHELDKELNDAILRPIVACDFSEIEQRLMALMALDEVPLPEPYGRGMSPTGRAR